MENAEQALVALYAEALRFGDELLRLLREPTATNTLRQVELVIMQREGTIAEAGRATNGVPPTGKALETLNSLAQQQQVLEQELADWVARQREAGARYLSAQQQVRSTQRMLGAAKRSRLVDQYR